MPFTESGYSLTELVVVAAVLVAICGMSVPTIVAGLDHQRAYGAARYVAARLMAARMTAVARRTAVGFRFTPGAPSSFRMFVDGNRNGIRTADVQEGVDPPIGDADVIANLFAGVDFGVLPNLPPVESGSAAPGTDPIKFGASNIASFSPIGTSSTGSLYILGRDGSQYVIRLFGDTAKVRILQFDRRTGKWTGL